MARRPAGLPTSTNLFAMYDVLEKNGGRIPPRVDQVDVEHLRRVIRAGFLQQEPDGYWVPTEVGRHAMEQYRSTRESSGHTPTQRVVTANDIIQGSRGPGKHRR